MQSLQTLLRDHRDRLLIADQLQASLERKVSGPTIETEIVDKQIEGINWEQDCVVCEHPKTSHEILSCYNGCYHAPSCDCTEYQAFCSAEYGVPCYCVTCRQAATESTTEGDKR